MKYQVGDIVEGTITHIEAYGAFLVFGGEVKGLLHISEISDGFIHDIKRYLHVGNVYRLKIISIDENTGFLKLSIKQISIEDRKVLASGAKNRLPIEDSEIDFKPLKDNLDKWVEEKLNS